MPIYFEFKCIFEKCPYFRKIVLASRSEIISHFKRHDYTELLEQAVEFGLIKDNSERRSPDWLAESLLEFCTNEVKQEWL